MKQKFLLSPDIDGSGDGSSTDTDTATATATDTSSGADTTTDTSSDTSSATTTPDSNTTNDDEGGDNDSTGSSSSDSDQPTNENSNQPTGSSSDSSADDNSSNTTDTPDSSDSDQPVTADDGQQAKTTTGSSGSSASTPKRPYNVESWRAMITVAANGLPVGVLMKWIEVESGGNPCSTGMIQNGSSIENGIFQLYSPDDDKFGSPAQLHGSFCDGQTQTCIRDLTSAEANAQVNSGIALVNRSVTAARSQLSQAGLTWDETTSDFWCLVKMQHIWPGPTADCIKTYKPSSWADFKNFFTQHYSKYTPHFDNAEKVGNGI